MERTVSRRVFLQRSALTSAGATLAAPPFVSIP